MLAARFLISVGLLACISGPASRLEAQDDRYWRQTYGTESTLLNGAVIGRATDVGTVFYNPAGLADKVDASILITGHVYEYDKISAVGVDPIAGEQQSLAQSALRPAPSFFGGTIPWKNLGRHRLGYSVLTRQQGDVRNNFRTGGQLNGELAQLEFLGINVGNEVWVAPSWAWKATDRFSIGASMFVAVRNQYLRSQITGQTLDDDGNVGLLSSIREFEYDSWRLVPKLGATLDLRPVTLGATVTLPSLRLWGSGSALFNSTSAGIDFNGDGVPDPAFASDLQEDVRSNFKSGLAVGLGAGWDVASGTTLFVSAEYYARVGPYEVLSTEPFEGQLDGVTRSNPLVHSSRPVTNVAAGVRHRFSPALAGYLSGASDLSAADTSFNVSLSKTLWDLYHVTGGVQFRVSRVDLVVGAGYTFGGEAVAVSGPPQAPGLIADPIEFQQRGIRFIFGFQYVFSGAGPTASAGDQ
jgi:hypothetical protein